MFQHLNRAHSLPSITTRFGIRSLGQVYRDLGKVVSHLGNRDRYAFDLSSAGFFRPDLSLPAYGGFAPTDGLSPIYNFFDRVGGGKDYHAHVTRNRARDYRGGRLTYDEHDGTDFVCPPGTPLCAAAPGVVIASIDRWLRGGLTACVDHGAGVVTQYTHLCGLVAEIGQPVARGDVVGLSGHSGLDMTMGFPWVPPHIHFMVFVGGRPVDPYLGPDEAPHPGTWLHRNDPRPVAGALGDDPDPASIKEFDVDVEAIERIVPMCRDAGRRAELLAAGSDAARAAIVEDSMHHERDFWPREAFDLRLRKPTRDPFSIKLTLPLPASDYRGARPVDAPWTRPAADGE